MRLPLPAVLIAMSISTRAAAADPALARDRFEPGVLPVMAGDTDVGFKLGAFGQLARFRDGVRPYAWRAQVLAVTSIKKEATGTEFPYREAAARLDWPAAAAPLLRPSFDVAYLRTTNRGYYGVGNASHAEQKWAGLPEGSDAYVAARRFYQFDGTTLRTGAAVIGAPLPFLRTLSSVRLERTSIEVYPGSLLEQEAHRLHGVGDYTGIVFGVGLAIDTRDHETVPTSGQHLQLAFRQSPGVFASEPYLGATLHLRSWFPVTGERLVIGARLIGDVLSRRAPLLELGRHGGFETGRGPGGGMGVRGLPDGRLIGRTKLIGNLEARSMFWHFQSAQERFTLGAAAFADAGRVYAGSFRSVSPLDGSGWTFHPGFGGGPRFRWGDSLLVRADFAYAPLARETGAVPGVYVDVEHVL
ncbi:MAG: BamA/TamA family outer membrane protein [Myxococcales bacterium]|nr:BamA/TamA family outer membrane protein [Myxococcales bacterium]